MKSAALLILLYMSLFVSAVDSQWAPQTSGVTDDLFSVYFVNETTGWMTGQNGRILATINGGTVWAQQVSGSGSTLVSVDFVSPSSGFAVGGLNSFLKTTNGGAAWALSIIPVLTNGAKCVDFADGNTGYVGGAEGKVAKTTNGGSTWTLTTIVTPTDFNALAVIDANNAFLAGISGIVYRTTNGGANWTLQPNASNNFISSIEFFDVNNGYFTTLGLSEEVYRTTNGGTTWNAVTSPGISAGLSGLSVINATTVYGAGPTGIVRRTTNGGTSWETQVTDVTVYQRGIFMVNSSVGYTCGNGGKIFKTTNGGIGIQQISTNVPEGFSLSQNYPNPFNPVTNIEFAIPKSGFVKLSVFDIAGKEIAVLVNQNLKTGTYKADFDAGSIASGLYFYKIETEDFAETKKMILIK